LALIAGRNYQKDQGYMSVFSVDLLCRDITRDTALRKRFQENPESALSEYPHPLSAQERTALLTGDVGTLYRMGVNAFLMGSLARHQIFGLDANSYGERMRAVDD
jgi:hypothetical protein